MNRRKAKITMTEDTTIIEAAGGSPLTDAERAALEADNAISDGHGASYPLIINEPAELVISGNTVNEYLHAGFKQSEVEGYERDVLAVLDGMAQSVTGYINAGERLQSMKERTGHGSWSFLLLRMGLSDRTAQRLMAAYQAVTTYPQLAERAGAFAPGTLALLGERKDVTPEAVNEIAAMAEQGEPTAELVLDEIRKHAAPKTPSTRKAKHKTYFAAMTAATAAGYQDKVTSMLAEIIGTMINAGADIPGLAKSAECKAYGKLCIPGTPADKQTPLQRALSGLIACAYIWDHPAPAE